MNSYHSHFSILFLAVCQWLACSGEQGDTEDGLDSHWSPDVLDRSDWDSDTLSGSALGRVELELSHYLEQARQDEGAAHLFVAVSESDLIEGERGEGSEGDFIIENDHVRFVVERDVRAIGPCPYGGNIIDGIDRTLENPSEEGGSVGGDGLGEICLLLNASNTVDPETYEILSDGVDGEPAVLAVTGPMSLLDFIDVQGMAGNELGVSGFELPVDTNEVMPLTATIYYILGSGDRAVQVVTALRNEGDNQVDIMVSHLFNVGGQLALFNPLSDRGGFGSSGLSMDNLDGDLLPFILFQGSHTGHAYVPTPDPDLGGEFPLSGVYLSISGVTVSVLGLTDLVGLLFSSPAQLGSIDGLLHLGHQETGIVTHRHWVGGAGINSQLDDIYDYLEVDTGPVQGTVTDRDDNPVEDVVVTAIDSLGRTLNQAVTDSDGGYEMSVPAGYWIELSGHLGQRRDLGTVTLLPEVSAVREGNLQMEDEARVSLTVKTPEGLPTPARVTVICDGVCGGRLSIQETGEELPPWHAEKVVFAGMSGEASFTVTPGAYRILVSRGPEWSIWPQDGLESHGYWLEIAEGESHNLTAEIAHVVDSSGAMSGDFHLHQLNSPDSTTRMLERVLSALGEGLDIAVTTDHDYITDLTPYIVALEAEAEIASIIGEELTTATYGHYNSFPLPHVPGSINGGAFDWAGEAGLNLSPQEIFNWFHEQPGEQVVQVNHPVSGFIGYLEADPLRGISLIDPAVHRLPETEEDPLTGDTGLWTDDFTAIEVLNGYSTGNMWAIMRWWFSMFGRGFSPTGTAVSDSHSTFNSPAGSPRTVVFLESDQDTPDSFLQAEFIEGINAGRAIGTTGPFFRFTATNGEESVGMGDVIAANGLPITFEVQLDLPEWMGVDTIEVYTNIEDIDTGGAAIYDPITPSFSLPIAWSEEDLHLVSEGVERHSHRLKTISFEIDTTEDSWVVVIARGLGDSVSSMYPVLHSNVAPLAFSNPIFIDGDGGGYDNPPLLHLLE
jgi:hypothetical protein